jgi:phage terminase large subunit-like protein
LIDVFNEYVSGVVGGEIVTGKYVRLAVERHLKDVANQGTDEFPYTFDEQRAGQAIGAFPAMFRHTVGQYAGQPFELTPWQAFIVGSLWGWRDDRGLRRFNRCYVTLARKNGKSTLAAGIAILMAAFDGEQQAQVYCGATKLDQAKIIFQECHRMIGASPHLSEQFDRRVVRINHEPTNSYIQALGSDKSWDGLNPSCVILDELHAFKELHRNFLDTITTGSASRLQPRYIAYIAQLDAEDDIFDEANWQKSMPNLGISVSPDYIREQAEEGKTSKIAENKFKRYFANQMVSPNEAAVDMQKWSACEEPLSDWAGADCVTAGVDIGGVNDMCAVAYVARFHDGVDEDGKPTYRYEATTQAFMDTDTRTDLSEMPWLQFIDRGDIKMVEYIHKAVYEHLKGTMLKHRAKQIAFDPWNSQQLAEELDKEGFQPIQVQQNRFKMNEPCLMLLDLIEKRKIRHYNEPVLNWTAQNLVLDIDNAGRVLPSKKESSGKIDNIVALLMALKLAALAPESPRGPMFIS